MKRYKKEQDDIKHIKDFIASCGTYKNLVAQAKSKQKILDKVWVFYSFVKCDDGVAAVTNRLFKSVGTFSFSAVRCMLEVSRRKWRTTCTTDFTSLTANACLLQCLLSTTSRFLTQVSILEIVVARSTVPSFASCMFVS